MNSLLRRTLRGIKGLAPNVRAEVLRQNKHIVLGVERPGHKGKVTMSLSPSVEDHAVLNAINDARRALNLEKP